MNMQKEERKIVKSINGIIIAVVNAIAMLVCLVGAVYYMYLYSCSASNPFTFSVLNMMHSVGFTASILLQLNNADDRVFVYLALGCYALACLPCLYIVLRALIQPTFVAGHPEKIKFLPLIFSPVLRIIYDAIICYKVGEVYYQHAFFCVILSMIYSFAIYHSYSLDDDNMPKTCLGTQRPNEKPWQYEQSNLPK